jgi:predicted transcriptional regulator/DNA-binding XRE family transcriptional regulator
MVTQDYILNDGANSNELFEIGIIGKNLKFLRRYLAISQAEIADDLGVSRKIIAKIESGDDLSFIWLQKYINSLGKYLKAMGNAPQDLIVRNRTSVNNNNFSDVSMQVILQLINETVLERRDFIISIKPEYSKKIFEGLKTIELRRRFPIKIPVGSIAYIYSTAPIRALIGSVNIHKVEKMSITSLWERHGESASIDKEDFEAYFHNTDVGYALYISNPRTFSRPVDLSELNKKFGFCAPQSFLYANGFLKRALENEFENSVN